MIDWDDVDSAISDVEEMLELVRDAWARDDRSDVARLEQLRYFYGKAQWEMVNLGMTLDAK